MSDWNPEHPDSAIFLAFSVRFRMCKLSKVQMIKSAIAICLILNKEHYYETGKDNIGVQCKHRLERDDRGDNSQTLHGKTPAGESSDKTIS